jgi:integrase
MKQQYRLFRRSGIYYVENTTTGKQESLRTRDRIEAQRLLHARNEAYRQPQVSLQIARAYLAAGDPGLLKRTWQEVMDVAGSTKTGPTLLRWQSAMRHKPFDPIRHLPLLETRAEHLLAVIARGSVSTNVYLRRLHNYALDMTWLPWPILVRKHWPKVHFKPKRGITLEEHRKILAGEGNREWIAYYQVLWHVGGAQTDVATLCAEHIDWETKVISFQRRKSGTQVQLHFGAELEQILSDLPGAGYLFPSLARMTESDRGSLFSRRCRLTGVSGVSLHSYRYAWAERAMECGYPERFAQEALGHTSKAVHRAYARKAQVKVPALEDWERLHLQQPEPSAA